MNSKRKRSVACLLICLLFVTSTIMSAASAETDSSTVLGHMALQNEAEYILSSMRSSIYQHVTHVDATGGVYDFDCSGFVDYVLQHVSPKALAAITYLPNVFNRPRAQDYYFFFTRIGSGDEVNGWINIANPLSLLPGDVIAWLVAPNSDSDDTGHVMIVRANPSIDLNRPNETLVAVIDSTVSPHALDSRTHGQTGLGTGTISLVMNSTKRAVGFRWRDGESRTVVYTKIAFGQLGPNQTSWITSSSNTAPTPSSDTRTHSNQLGEESIGLNSLFYPAAFTILLVSLLVVLVLLKKTKRY